MQPCGLLVRLTAKSGQESELSAFLKSALPLAQAELGTKTWYAIQINSNTFGIFDTFSSDSERQAHISGAIAKALFAKAPELLEGAPTIEKNRLTCGQGGVVRGRPRSFQTADVIDKAMQAFWKHGYDQVSMDMLCKLTKLTKPSFYNAFESKEKLFLICLREYQRKYAAPLLGSLLEDSQPLRGFSALLKAAARQFREPALPAGCLILTGALEAKGKTKAIDKELATLQSTLLSQISEYFSLHLAEGSSTSAVAIAQFVLSQLYAIALFSRTTPQLIDFEKFVETAEVLMKRLLK